MPRAPSPEPVTPVVLNGWAVRLEQVAAQVRALAGDLRRHGAAAGLVGPAGDALGVLVHRRVRQLQVLADDCETVARSLAREAAQVVAREAAR